MNQRHPPQAASWSGATHRSSGFFRPVRGGRAIDDLATKVITRHGFVRHHTQESSWRFPNHQTPHRSTGSRRTRRTGRPPWTCTPTPCRCHCWSGWPRAASPTSPPCRRASSGWIPGSAGLAPALRCRWRNPSTTSGSGSPRWTRSARRSTQCHCLRSCSAPRPTTSPLPPASSPRAMTSWPSTSRRRLIGCSGWGTCRSAGPVSPTRPGGCWTTSDWRVSPSVARAAARISTIR